MKSSNLHTHAAQIADAALARTNGVEASALSLAGALGAFRDHCRWAQDQYNGRELTLFEAQPEKIGRLFDLLIEGNYRETAARIVGISDRVIRQWMERAEDGDPRYVAFADVVKVAEAIAESSAVRSVRAAGKDPRFWAAEMTYLERRHPDRWGRRLDEGQTPRVVVQIGVKDSDVQVNLITPAAAAQLTPIASDGT